MKRTFLLIFLSLSFIMAQSWKSAVDPGISAGGNERISLFSNQADSVTDKQPLTQHKRPFFIL